MSAEPQPRKQTVEERAEAFVAPFQMKYNEAIEAARHAAETTQTEAWQLNFAIAMKAHAGSRDATRQTIEHLAETLKSRDLNEDQEKELGDAKKALVEERIRHQAWFGRAVSPYLSTVERCDHIKDNALGEADSVERQHGLIAHGLAAAVRGNDRQVAVRRVEQRTGHCVRARVHVCLS